MKKLPILLLAVIALFLGLPAKPALAATYTVDTTSDATLTGCTAIFTGDCSLRGAIQNANAAGTPGDIIAFSSSVFPAATPATISIGSSLPLLVGGGDTIDATGRGVEVDGVGGTFNCLTLFSSNNVVKGLQVADCDIGIDVQFSGNTVGPANVIADNATGIRVAGNTNNVVSGNFIGTSADGTAVNPSGGNTSDGVLVTGDSNRIGGDEASERNIISGNGTGVRVDSAATGNVISGNYIGTDVTGNVDLGNNNGISILGGSSANTVGGTVAGTRNVISGNGNDGITLSEATGNTISGNYIGTNAGGTGAMGNGEQGVEIFPGADGNTIGGTAGGAGNLISGNLEWGIRLTGVTNNMIQGNYVGTDAGGTAAIPNTFAGVLITGGSTGNTVGGTTAGARNVISGNGNDGIGLETTTGNTISGNYVGTNALGTAALANSDQGIEISAGADANTIGGTVAGARNVISGNTERGIRVNGSTNTIHGNYVGTTAAGTTAIPNLREGILITSDSNFIGGTVAGARNVISGNQEAGISASTANVFGTTIRANFVGLQPDGVSALGNGSHGIHITNSAHSVIVGGITGGENRIAFNGGDGVYVDGGSGNVVLRNEIHSNAGLGIDLGPEGVTSNDGGAANDSDAGPNDLQNFPELTLASSFGGSTNIQGVLDSLPNQPFTLSFYYNDECDPSGYGEAQTLAGSTNVMTDANGLYSINETFAVSVPSGSFLTATAHDSGPDNTSEFSNCVSVPSLIVNDTGDPGDGTCTVANCTLREAITAANSTLGVEEVIHFAIGSGPQTISPLSALPGTALVTIDGTSQPGFAGTPIIEISGQSAPPGHTGLVFTGNSTVRGLVVNRWPAYGVILQNSGGNAVEGNYIGTDMTGTGDLGNGLDGVLINNTSGNTIGGPTAAQRNVISGNNINAIRIFSAGATGNQILGNTIGLDVTRTTDLGNTGDGVNIHGGADNNVIGGLTSAERNIISGNNSDGVSINDADSVANEVIGNYIGTSGNAMSAVPNGLGVNIFAASLSVIGGDTPAHRNVISGNSGVGVRIDGGASGNLISGNYIGTTQNGSSDLGNDGFGVQVLNGDDNYIGGEAAGDTNVIAFNSTGVFVQSGIGNEISANAIQSNDALGIDLAPGGVAGVTPNDTTDVDSGPNRLQNFPVLTLVGDDLGQAPVQGLLDSAPSTTFTLEFFYNTACDGSGQGEGEEAVGSMNVVTNANGLVAFSATLSRAAGNFTGGFVTATATDPLGNTSEFSLCKAALADNDGDGDPDVADNCPAWPNPTQTLPAWPVPANDIDCDGFSAITEGFVGTDPAKHCNETTTTNDEPDYWPTDFNDSRFTSNADLILMGPSYNKVSPDPAYNKRFDLNANNSVTNADVILMGPFYNKGCG